MLDTDAPGNEKVAVKSKLHDTIVSTLFIYF